MDAERTLEFNARNIAEFRSSGGKLGGRFATYGANPSATVELGTDTFPVTATEITGAEHDRLYGIQAQRYPGFATYRERTDRVIPVVELSPVNS